MSQHNSEPTVQRGEYVVNTADHSPHEEMLFRATKDSFVKHDREVVVGEPVFSDADKEKSRVTLPVDCLELATERGDDPAAHRLQSFQKETRSRHTSAGVFTLPPGQREEWCPACGSNAVEWAQDEVAGVAGEWCAVCGFEMRAP